ncbi:MAG: hypothetical protein H7296_11390 [Bacteroidia bacterium]|nr:hypothetical protein [Bacteroidia bacterium]
MFKLNQKCIVFVLFILWFIPGVLAQDSLITDTFKPANKKYIISVVMPFCNKQILFNPQTKNAALGNACRQYFEGFKLALDSFNKSVVPIEIRVFDTQGDSNIFKIIMNKTDFQESNLIFGPVVKDGHTMMKPFCEKYKVYNISPFLTLTKSKINNPYLISSYPDLSYYGDFILEQIKQGGWDDANVVILTGKEANEKIIAARIMALKLKYAGFTLKIIDINKYLDYCKVYRSGRPNHVIIESDNEFSVTTAMRYLADTTLFSGLITYGSKKILEFKSPDISMWQHLNLNVVSPFYIDYQNAKVKLFIERYRERYYSEPAEFAFNGYEQATFFITYFLENNGLMDKIIEKNQVKPISNWFKIRAKIEGKGLQSSKLNMLYFEDNELKRWE